MSAQSEAEKLLALAERADAKQSLTAGDLKVCPSCGALPIDWADNPFGDAAINAAVERMRADPFGDDAHLLGTTQQDERMRHYARLAFTDTTP